MRTQSDQSLTYKKPHTPSTSSSSPSTFEFLLKQKQMMETGDINVHVVAENITVLELNQSEGCTIVGDKNTYPHVINSVKATINQDYHHHTNSLWPPSGLILEFFVCERRQNQSSLPHLINCLEADFNFHPSNHISLVTT